MALSLELWTPFIFRFFLNGFPTCFSSFSCSFFFFFLTPCPVVVFNLVWSESQSKKKLNQNNTLKKKAFKMYFCNQEIALGGHILLNMHMISRSSRQRCSVKKEFLKISQISENSIFVGVSF